MKIKTTDLILFLILFFALVESMSSCTTSKITHTPSKREIKRAMKCSTSDYYLPTEIKTTSVTNKSQFKFTYDK